MTFMAGLGILAPEEKVALLAQMESLTGKNLIGEKVQIAAKQTKGLVLRGAGWAARWISADLEKKVSELDSRTDWDPRVIQKGIANETSRLSVLTPRELSALLREHMARIAQIGADVDDQVLANAIIHRAAKSLKLDIRMYTDPASLEGAVFEACVRELIYELQKHLNKMSPSKAGAFDRILRDEIAKLGKADQDAIKRVIGVDSLSSKAVTSFIKTTSSAAMAQLLLGGAGFGSFLFLTAMLKAISLLMGMTFPFGVYTALTSILAFTLSAPFLLLIAGLSGGFVLRSASRAIEDQMAKLLIMIGRGKILSRVS